MKTFPAIKGPFLCLEKRTFRKRETIQALFTTTSAGLKNGMFDGVTVIGIEGKAVKFKSASKLRSVGPFFGCNIFLNQRIIVQPEGISEVFDLTLEEAKNRIFDYVRRGHTWSSRDDTSLIEKLIRDSSSFIELFDVLNVAN